MTLPRAELRRGRVARAGRLRLGADWGPPGFELVESPVAEVRAEQDAHGGIRLTGVVRARVRHACSRCLESSVRDLEVPIDLRFEPGLDVWDEGPGMYRLEEAGDDVNVVPALREELVLALPDYPLCQDDCRGLCPSCGEKRDGTECDCDESELDARWDALRELRDGPDRRTEDG